VPLWGRRAVLDRTVLPKPEHNHGRMGGYSKRKNAPGLSPPGASAVHCPYSYISLIRLSVLRDHE